ncbi:MAG: hypothetical protein ACREU4_14540, partial [Burkholderiales bacterium]
MDASGGPIHSHFEDDPSHADAIEAFVVALAERVDSLQDNEARSDWPRLIAGLDELARAAAQAGYPQLAEVAAEVARAASERHCELAHKALVELTDVAQRIRRGHR